MLATDTGSPEGQDIDRWSSGMKSKFFLKGLISRSYRPIVILIRALHETWKRGDKNSDISKLIEAFLNVQVGSCYLDSSGLLAHLV